MGKISFASRLNTKKKLIIFIPLNPHHSTCTSTSTSDPTFLPTVPLPTRPVTLLHLHAWTTSILASYAINGRLQAQT